MKNKSFDKTIIIVRYLMLLIYTFIYIMYKDGMEKGHIIFLLMFIVNSQIRYFNIDKNINIIKVSLLLDVLLIMALYEKDIVYFGVYFMISCLDTVLFLKKKQANVFLLIYLVLAIFLFHNVSALTFIINMGIISIFLLLVNQLVIENDRVVLSQSLYDQLRIKEEELVVLNKELEGYASSVETLTLLRERTRMTRELHDHIGHRLSASFIQLGAVEKIIDNNPDKAKEMVKYLKEYNQESLKDVRGVINELKPQEFENYEGIMTIEQLIKNFEKLTGVNVKIIILNKEYLWKLSEQQTFILYRVIQEGLSNSLRHGKAKNIEIRFNFQKDKLILISKDDGVGCDHIQEGNGLQNMSDRIKLIGGTIQYETKIEEGFLLLFTIPKDIGGVIV